MRWTALLLLPSVACGEFSVHAQGDDPEIPEEVDTDVEPVEETDIEEPVATLPVYAHTRTELYSIEPGNGSRTRIGTFTEGSQVVDGMIDVAIDLEGRMYGATWTSLFLIDPETAEATWICDTDEELYAMTFTSSGKLFGGAGERVVELNVENCQAHALFSQSDWETSGDLVGLPDGYLYWTVRTGGNDGVVRVDPDNGDSTWVGNTGFKKLFGLGYDDGNLFGFSDDGEIVKIDPDNGTGTLLSSNQETEWWGATTNPVVW